MKILTTITHFYRPNSKGVYGSTRSNFKPRIHALSKVITALRALTSQHSYAIDIANRSATAVAATLPIDIDIVVLTTESAHLLNELPIPRNWYAEHPTQAEPMLLGYECHAYMHRHKQDYDYFAYLEDDIVIEDALFFHKLKWFNTTFGERTLLQPHRFELSQLVPACKVYIDGDIRPSATAQFQDIHVRQSLTSTVLGQSLSFTRCTNPHSGCFFLSQAQLAYWSAQPYFYDRATSFIGPLESAATLGCMRSFEVYKPATTERNFFEVLHAASAYAGLLGNTIKLSAPPT